MTSRVATRKFENTDKSNLEGIDSVRQEMSNYQETLIKGTVIGVDNKLSSLDDGNDLERASLFQKDNNNEVFLESYFSSGGQRHQGGDFGGQIENEESTDPKELLSNDTLMKEKVYDYIENNNLFTEDYQDLLSSMEKVDSSPINWRKEYNEKINLIMDHIVESVASIKKEDFSANPESSDITTGLGRFIEKHRFTRWIKRRIFGKNKDKVEKHRLYRAVRKKVKPLLIERLDEQEMIKQRRMKFVLTPIIEYFGNPQYKEKRKQLGIILKKIRVLRNENNNQNDNEISELNTKRGALIKELNDYMQNEHLMKGKNSVRYRMNILLMGNRFLAQWNTLLNTSLGGKKFVDLFDEKYQKIFVQMVGYYIHDGMLFDDQNGNITIIRKNARDKLQKLSGMQYDYTNYINDIQYSDRENTVDTMIGILSPGKIQKEVMNLQNGYSKDFSLSKEEYIAEASFFGIPVDEIDRDKIDALHITIIKDNLGRIKKTFDKNDMKKNITNNQNDKIQKVSKVSDILDNMFINRVHEFTFTAKEYASVYDDLYAGLNGDNGLLPKNISIENPITIKIKKTGYDQFVIKHQQVKISDDFTVNIDGPLFIPSKIYTINKQGTISSNGLPVFLEPKKGDNNRETEIVKLQKDTSVSILARYENDGVIRGKIDIDGIKGWIILKDNNGNYVTKNVDIVSQGGLEIIGPLSSKNIISLDMQYKDFLKKEYNDKGYMFISGPLVAPGPQGTYGDYVGTVSKITSESPVVKLVNSGQKGGNFGDNNGVVFFQNNDKNNKYASPILYTEEKYNNGLKDQDKELLLQKSVAVFQNGPILLKDGENPHDKNTTTKVMRVGIGWKDDGSIIFLQSTEGKNLYHFAEDFRNNGCTNAIYLDGGVESAAGYATKDHPNEKLNKSRKGFVVKIKNVEGFA